MTLKIAMGNGHNEQTLVKWAKEADAHSFGAHEAQRLIDEFAKKMPDHRITVAGRGWHEERNRARSTCILTDNNLENLGELTRKASEKIPGNERLAPDRVLVGSMYAHPVARRLEYEGIAHFAAHPDASPQRLRGDDPMVPVVREYGEFMRTLVRTVLWARRDDLIPVITGDLQLPPDVDRPWSPKHVLVDALGFDYVHNHIDWILWPKDLLEMVPNSLVKRKLHDHTGMKVSLRAKGF
jgi:hypothetical protein